MEDFFIKSLLAGIGICISTSLLGVFILWKKMSYFGDAISHSAILGLALSAILATQPIIGIVIFAIFFAICVNILGRTNLYSQDTVIGIISYICLAIGLLLIAIFPQYINLNSYLFGDIIAVSIQEILLIYFGSSLVILAMIFWFKKLLLLTINKDLAAIQGVNVGNLQLKFLLLVALIIALSIKIIGIFLITAMLILPAAIARNFSKTPIQMMFLTLIISLFGTISGLYISFFYDLPVSPAIIGVLSIIFILTIFTKKT